MQLQYNSYLGYDKSNKTHISTIGSAIKPTWIMGALAQEPRHSTSLRVNSPSAVVSPSCGGNSSSRCNSSVSVNS